MGVHISFVRYVCTYSHIQSISCSDIKLVTHSSVDLDEWTPQQILGMKLGGNLNAKTYFRKHGVADGFKVRDAICVMLVIGASTFN